MKKILLVEDNPADVLLTLRVFAQANIEAEIVVAEDGVVALEMLAEPEAMEPVLILMDINMPRKNGKDVLKEIKATTRFRHIPVVMLTTSDARDDIRESYENYASGYIVKPARLGEFMKAVQTLKNFWFETVTLLSGD
ncbi:response regulator [Ponticaulis koreensis]|uniref:response regulator n=1 Tax=Ponticaulis koreensis TaxID=1123045 RepID=UPI0003B6F4CD|nr:response regulator [Ponticaulis koreensis]